MHYKGKVKSFFEKEVKKLEKAIIVQKRNLENSKFNSENALNDLREKLEDAQNALEAAFTAVTIEDIKTNADSEIFSEKYWSNIDSKERDVQHIESLIKEEIERMEKQEKTINDNISILETRIEAIS